MAAADRKPDVTDVLRKNMAGEPPKFYGKSQKEEWGGVISISGEWVGGFGRYHSRDIFEVWRQLLTENTDRTGGMNH